MLWRTTRYDIDCSIPRVMGIVNCTPDSFADPARGADEAIALCARLVAEGADLLDIGGESTRPGAEPVGVDVELQRILPVIDAALRLGVPVSVDTRHVETMRAVLARGVDVINDVQALRAPGALDVVASHGRCGVCLMHMRGAPATMANEAQYEDVVRDVRTFLVERLGVATQGGIDAQRVVLDPGIGFAKTAAHNLELLSRQAELSDLGRPLLVGWSRKSTLGRLTGGKPAAERLAASVAAAVIAVERGARIVRVHDVAATVDALAVWKAARAPRR
ncbi:MAG TPA: dihydropteroate synthase [Caldimonas sp.]|nr:dihydropteroate synthase [Caldimonas sp.]